MGGFNRVTKKLPKVDKFRKVNKIATNFFIIKIFKTISLGKFFKNFVLRKKAKNIALGII